MCIRDRNCRMLARGKISKNLLIFRGAYVGLHRCQLSQLVFIITLDWIPTDSDFNQLHTASTVHDLDYTNCLRNPGSTSTFTPYPGRHRDKRLSLFSTSCTNGSSGKMWKSQKQWKSTQKILILHINYI